MSLHIGLNVIESATWKHLYYFTLEVIELICKSNPHRYIYVQIARYCHANLGKWDSGGLFVERCHPEMNELNGNSGTNTIDNITRI